MVNFLNQYARTVAVAIVCGCVGTLSAHEYHSSKKDWKLAEGEEQVGDGHGEIAVASNGEIYVSVQGGPKKGLQVFDKDGKYLRNVKGAPSDFHGFVIHQEKDGEFIYGAGMTDGRILKMTLDGKVVLEIKKESIPEKYRKVGKKPEVKLTSVAVAPNGDIYVVDGYGLDFIHQYDAKGKYLKTFGGREAPYSFSNCHKIAIDPRFDPVRLLCTNRAKGTLVHVGLDGSMIGIHARDLRRPSAVAFKGDHVVVAEIVGRISVLDKEGKSVTVVSDNPAKYKGNRWKPEEWKEGIVGSPHGIAFDAEGNILMTEYNRWGRLMRFDLKK